MTGKVFIAAALAAFVFHPSFGRAPHADSDPNRPVSASRKAASPAGDVAAPLVDVTGQAKLLGGAPHAVKDLSNVVVWLASLDPAGLSQRPASPRRHYRMLQKNKTFDPALLVVPLGSVVDFPNLDPWFHNVFSLYQGKRFDLGLYQAGAEKEVVFDRPGPSFLFCNIHPQMTAVILSVNSDLFGVSDKSGRILIPAVPAGAYRMHVWYENAAPEFTDAAQRIDVSPASSALPAISIPVARHDHAHKDKYGNDYDPKAASPSY